MKLLLLFVAIFGVSCSSISGVKKVDQPKFPAMDSKIVNVKKGFVIDKGFKPPVGTFDGKTWDLKKSTLALVGGDCSNKESGERITVELDNLTIKNGKFSKFEDGMQLRAKNITIDGVVYESCEDSINSFRGCDSFTIKNSFFKPHDKKETSEDFRGDKSIQANITKGNNVIENNVFWNYMNGIRHGLKKYNDPKTDIGSTIIRKNKFVYVSTAVQRTLGKVKMEDNEFISVGEEYKETD